MGSQQFSNLILLIFYFLKFFLLLDPINCYVSKIKLLPIPLLTLFFLCFYYLSMRSFLNCNNRDGERTYAFGFEGEGGV